MDASDRRLAVSWSPVDGAAGYKVAARLTNGVEPFEWSEYEAESSPYVITERWTAMSGLEYEVRAASVNVHGHPAWSPSVYMAAPELHPAPTAAIHVDSGERQYAVGDLMRVSAGSQRPFANRSPFVWSVCDIDGSGCELLPLVSSPTYIYLVPSAAFGKRVQVQVDYDKDGLSRSATAVVGLVSREAPPPPILPTPVFPPGCEGAKASFGADGFRVDDAIATHLHYIESKSVKIEWDAASGGAVEPLCNDLLIVTPWGRITLLRADGEAERIEGRVPMGLEELLSHPNSGFFSTGAFRVADILLKQHSEERWELFVTHHYFTGDCIGFRLSSATILSRRGTVSVSPDWRTIFDAKPCLDPLGILGIHAGGRMVTDGPDHLLIVIGDLGAFSLPQDPDSHLGKLVRVAIGSGEAEVLARGLRNPQGLARDADGNLWATEHGPKGGDELNLLEPGSNYGWPSVSYGVEDGGVINVHPQESVGMHENFVKPRFAWVPSIAVSAMVVNDERWFPLWKDDLLVSSLSGGAWLGGVSGEALFRVRRDGTDIQYVERIPLGYSIRDLTQMPDGRIAVLDGENRIRFLSRSEEYCDERSRRIRLVYTVGCGPLDATGEGAPPSGNDESPTPTPPGGRGGDETAASFGAQLYATQCAACHRLAAEEHGVGPHLVGLIGRGIGEAEGWNFSEALRSLDGVWTRDSLAQFLADPQEFAPGTAMGSPGLSPAEAGAVADYIANPSGGVP